MDTDLLGCKAMECRAYAKALHYKEDQFHKCPSTDVLQNLISINNKLGQEEAATGDIIILSRIKVWLLGISINIEFVYYGICTLVSHCIGYVGYS